MFLYLWSFHLCLALLILLAVLWNDGTLYDQDFVGTKLLVDSVDGSENVDGKETFAVGGLIAGTVEETESVSTHLHTETATINTGVNISMRVDKDVFVDKVLVQVDILRVSQIW